MSAAFCFSNRAALARSSRSLRQRQLGLLDPAVLQPVELADLAAHLLLVGDRARRGGAHLDQRLLHLEDDHSDHLRRVLRLVEQVGDVGGDDVARPRKNTHGKQLLGFGIRPGRTPRAHPDELVGFHLDPNRTGVNHARRRSGRPPRRRSARCRPAWAGPTAAATDRVDRTSAAAAEAATRVKRSKLNILQSPCLRCRPADRRGCLLLSSGRARARKVTENCQKSLEMSR